MFFKSDQSFELEMKLLVKFECQHMNWDYGLLKSSVFLVPLKSFRGIEFVWENLSKWGNGYNLYSRYYSMEETTERHGLGFVGRVRACGTMRG